MKPRFVMLEEESSRFYDVDLETALLDNPADWVQNGIYPEKVAGKGKGLAIIFPTPLDDMKKTELKDRGYKPNFQVGRLVALDVFRAINTPQTVVPLKGKTIGKVNVAPFDSAMVSWPLLKEKKGPVLPDEMKAGLLGKLWGHDRPSYTGSEFVTSLNVLENMPRRWHRDPRALNYELDNMFAVGKELASADWVLDDSKGLLKPTVHGEIVITV